MFGDASTTMRTGQYHGCNIGKNKQRIQMYQVCISYLLRPVNLRPFERLVFGLAMGPSLISTSMAAPALDAPGFHTVCFANLLLLSFSYCLPPLSPQCHVLEQMRSRLSCKRAESVSPPRQTSATSAYACARVGESDYNGHLSWPITKKSTPNPLPAPRPRQLSHIASERSLLLFFFFLSLLSRNRQSSFRNG
jgi:hypothetical protein